MKKRELWVPCFMHRICNPEEWGREGGDGGIQEEGRGFHLNEYIPGRGGSTTLGKTYCVAQAMDTHYI